MTLCNAVQGVRRFCYRGDLKTMKLSFNSACVHGTYRAQAGQPQELPIAQSTTYRYYNTADVAAMFDLKSSTHMYTRISNPTVEALEGKMNLLEGGAAAVATSSGQAAILMALLNICEAGDHILASTNIYGGSHNLITVSFAKMGITHTLVDPDAPLEEILAAATPNTKALFAETIANPALTVLDFEKWSAAAKKLGVPLIVDNTLATPYCCRPLELGANIVVHSTTKYSDGHATSVGGMVIDGGTFDWEASGKYPGLTEPDESYHGLVYTKQFGNTAYAAKLRSQLLRDFGAVMAPQNAWLTHLGLETLHLRMQRHCENALALAKHLEQSPYVQWVSYPGLESSGDHAKAEKYLPNGCGGVLSFGVKGGLAAGTKFIENLEMTSLVVHVGDLRTSVLHPSSTTHRQLSEADQIAAGIRPELIRVSIGIEDIADIIADFDQALEKACK